MEELLAGMERINQKLKNEFFNRNLGEACQINEEWSILYDEILRELIDTKKLIDFSRTGKNGKWDIVSEILLLKS